MLLKLVLREQRCLCGIFNGAMAIMVKIALERTENVMSSTSNVRRCPDDSAGYRRGFLMRLRCRGFPSYLPFRHCCLRHVSGAEPPLLSTLNAARRSFLCLSASHELRHHLYGSRSLRVACPYSIFYVTSGFTKALSFHRTPTLAGMRHIEFRMRITAILTAMRSCCSAAR